MGKELEKISKAFLSEIGEIRSTLLIWFAVFLVLTVSLFPFSSTLFEKIYSGLVPSNIKPLLINPLNILFIQIQVSIFFAFLLSFPILAYKIISYLSPALYIHEKKIITQSLIPSLILFLFGCIFAYFLLIPTTLKVLNSYNSSLGATVYFEISQFITFALMAILVSGLAFTLPIFMRGLSRLKLIDGKTWIQNFRYSLIAIVILTAIITPDGTGVTMLMLSIPLICLYLLGCFLSKEVSFVNGA